MANTGRPDDICGLAGDKPGNATHCVESEHKSFIVEPVEPDDYVVKGRGISTVKSYFRHGSVRTSSRANQLEGQFYVVSTVCTIPPYSLFNLFILIW